MKTGSVCPVAFVHSLLNPTLEYERIFVSAEKRFSFT
jgi:hypothetical protein